METLFFDINYMGEGGVFKRLGTPSYRKRESADLCSAAHLEQISALIFCKV
jgi:hypothetical protein